MRTRIKICGITRLEDALAVVDAGADAIGFVFYPPSPRNVSIEQAKSIIDRLSPFCSVTALFVNAEVEVVESVIAAMRIDLLQFHGDEPEQYCIQFGKPFIKALRISKHTNIEKEVCAYPSSLGFLLDSFVEGVPGGTGKQFDWAKVPPNLNRPMIVAGGLTPTNVREAIVQTKPFAVDVSGGVELSKGIKDHSKIKAFVHEVNYVNKID